MALFALLKTVKENKKKDKRGKEEEKRKEKKEGKKKKPVWEIGKGGEKKRQWGG